MNRRLLAVVLVVGIVPLASCSHGDGTPAPYSLRVEGTAVVSGPHAATLGSGTHKLAVGDTVRVTKGSATLALPKKASLELRAGRSDSVVRVAAAPTIVDGDALAVAGDAGMRMRSGAAVVDLTKGAAHLRRSSGVTLAVYAGVATVDALGQQLDAPALRQLAVSDTGALPSRPVPLVYDRANPDPWDVRYLGDAIDLGTQLERRSRALTAQFLIPSSDAAFLTSVVPPLRTARGFSPALVDPQRSVGETVVGASIALGGDGEFVGRWTSAFELRQEGADWGLVAVDQRAQRAAVFSVLDGVLSSVQGTLVATAPSRRGTSGTSGATSSTTSTTSPGAGSTTTSTSNVPRVTVPPLDLPSTTTSTTTKPRSQGTTTTIPPTTVPPQPDPLEQLLGPILRGLKRPTELHLPDVRSGDDGRGDQRRGGRAQAVLDGLQRVRPLRGPRLPGPARVDVGHLARAGTLAQGAGRGTRAAGLVARD